MTAEISPFKLLEAQRMKPRECIDVWMIGTKAAFHELAVLRARHPGGAPNINPAAWTGAFENGRLVAAVGWTMFEEGIVTMQEIDKTADRWGTIGATVLLRSFIAGAYDKKMRVQAWVMPDNHKLKSFIKRNVPTAKCVLEVWE